MQRQRDSILSFLGLARRAGAIAPGMEAVRRAIRDGEACLVVTAEDASRLQLKKIESKVHERAIPRVILGDRNTLGEAVGTGPLSAIAVTDQSFARQLAERLESRAGDGSIDALEA